MKMNKRDIHIYKRFLDQIEAGYNDKLLDKYTPYIARFIDRFYTSDSNDSFDLEDFIMEALLLLSSRRNLEEEGKYDSGFFLMGLRNIYQRLKKNETNSNTERLNKQTVDNRDFVSEVEFQDFIDQYGFDEKRKIFIETYLNGMIGYEIAEQLKTSNQYASQLKFRVLNFIKDSDEFKEYYGIEVEKLLEYEKFLEVFLDISYRLDLVDFSKSLKRNNSPKNIGSSYHELLDIFTYLESLMDGLDIRKYERFIKKDKEELEKRLAKRSGK